MKEEGREEGREGERDAEIGSDRIGSVGLAYLHHACDIEGTCPALPCPSLSLHAIRLSLCSPPIRGYSQGKESKA